MAHYEHMNQETMFVMEVGDIAAIRVECAECGVQVRDDLESFTNQETCPNGHRWAGPFSNSVHPHQALLDALRLVKGGESYNPALKVWFEVRPG